MNVFLTFDIEVWCNGWDDLDRAFPGSFQRYVYGRSPDGDYALPKTLAILNQHGLKGFSLSSRYSPPALAQSTSKLSSD